MLESRISSDLLRGHTDTIVLKLLLEGDKYGYEISKLIQSKSG
jgi:PadR family transcriptional regulator PadR